LEDVKKQGMEVVREIQEERARAADRRAEK
jgi:hypothetical protein